MIWTVKSRRFFHLINTILTICIVGIACTRYQAKESPIAIERSTPIPSAPTKQISSISLSLNESWRWLGLIGNMSGTPLVVIREDRIVIVTRATLGKSKVVVLNAHTGTITWESDSIDNLSSLYADNKNVYVGTIRNVQAYDLKTGQLLWEGARQDINKRGGLNIYAEGNHLNVYDSYNNRLYILDSETGEIIKEIDYPALYFVKDNIYLSDACSSNLRVTCLNAIEGINGNLLWSHDFGAGIRLWPVFIGSTFFINSGGDIFAIDIQIGDIKWDFTQDSYVTGLALGDNRLYAIRNDAAIVSFDPETGEQVEVIEMTPKQDIEYKGGEVPYIPYYTIAASNNFVAAYYSNSQELIVFEKINGQDGNEQ